MSNEKTKAGYYSVNILVGEHKLPYIVFARSEYDAARKVRQETGYLAQQQDVYGPRQREW